MQGQFRPYGAAFIGFAVLAVGVSLGMSAITLFARWGLGFPLELLISCVAIVVVATLGPSLWAWQSPERQTWVGPLTAISLVMSCGVIALAGIIGVVVVSALAVASLGYLFREIAERKLYIAPRQIAIGCAIAFASAMLFATELGGTKYINFLVDQLIQHGRADGDDYLNAALTASIRAHFFPATGIDGLEPARYHFGFYALAAMLAGVAGEDAAVALIGLQMLVLVPMLSFALAQGAAILASRLFVDQQSPTLALAVGAFVLVALLQLSGTANLVSHSTSMLIGGIMLSLLAPSLLAASHAVEGRANATSLWWLSAVAIPFLAVSKISIGYLWTSIAGYLSFRQLGLKRASLWLLGLAMAVLFFGSLYLLAPTGGGGGKLFGTPYYVERGFAEGNYFLPLQWQWQSLSVLCLLILLRRHFTDRFRRQLLEATVVALIVGNLPGLLMEIAGGDAVYFLASTEWLAAPMLLAIVAGTVSRLPTGIGTWRYASWVGVAAAVIIVIFGLVKTVPLRANTFVSAEALVHTGDSSYFSDHGKRALEAGARRALADRSLIALMNQPISEPAGASLARELRSMNTEAERVVAYAAPESQFWTLVSECDGASLWPMAVGGVSMLAGQTASKTACGEGQILGENLADAPVPAVRDVSQICDLARQRGFDLILVIDRVEVAPSKIDCTNPS
jgi:hypothetical protein